MTLAEALKHGTEKIGRREAMLLLSHASGFSGSKILLHRDESLTDCACAIYLKCLERRNQNEPLQYIIGKWDFMGLEFNVDKRALIPRPETELLVEEVLKFIKSRRNNVNFSPLRVLDVCTGSGCIALAIVCLTDAKTVASVTATDISRDALALAEENANKLNIPPGRVNFIESDLVERLLNCGNDKFDIVISNPPYILHNDMAGLSQDVRDFEPHLALDGGVDGLDIYRRLIPQSKKILRPGGGLFLEIGPVQVADLLSDAGFFDIAIKRDYAGLDRIVTGRVLNV
ncbi:MAG: peptide chain release factor N(5)-glutamine methyltransferase [Defluviitaleaceae bacterium]|nr:peptide chain release factor N(5)-glutamine methyltransferase [Defluviitaleaceae bacterium]